MLKLNYLSCFCWMRLLGIRDMELWLRGDKNTRFFHKIANAHEREQGDNLRDKLLKRTTDE